MKKADIIYSEDNLLRILDGLEARGNWRQALAVIEWVYNENSYRHRKSRQVFSSHFSLLLPCHCEQHILTKKRSCTLILPISNRFFLSRFVYTKLLSILGKSLRATEALRVFTIMRVQSFFGTIKINSQLVCTENRKANGLTFFWSIIYIREMLKYTLICLHTIVLLLRLVELVF